MVRRERFHQRDGKHQNCGTIDELGSFAVAAFTGQERIEKNGGWKQEHTQIMDVGVVTHKNAAGNCQQKKR